MAKRKCPQCGSSEVVNIVYGYPGYDLFQASERKEIHLGGCCITGDDPKYHCKACGDNFYDAKHFRFLDIKEIEFSVGSYFGGHSFFYLSMEKNLIRYAECKMPFTVSLIEETVEQENLVKYIEIPFSNDLNIILFERFSELQLYKWKSKYIDSEVCDGECWELKIKLNNGRIRTFSGIHEYPKNYADFLNLLNGIFNEELFTFIHN